jgi:hypothetical protein
MDLGADCCQLLTPTGGSQLDPHCSWQKPHNVQRQHVHVHSGPYNVQTVVEQCPQHRGGAIHVFGPKTILSDGGLRLL